MSQTGEWVEILEREILKRVAQRGISRADLRTRLQAGETLRDLVPDFGPLSLSTETYMICHLLRG